MSKIFELNNLGSLLDQASFSVPTNTGVEIRRTEKGLTGYYDGSSQLEFANKSDFNFGTGNFSYAVVFKNADFTAGANYLFGKYNGAAGTDYGYNVIKTGTDNLAVYFDNSSADIDVNAGISDGQFHLLVVTRDGDDGYLYVDNVQIGTVSGISARECSSDADLTIGNDDGDFGVPDWKGFIGQIKMYNHALTQSERNVLYAEFLGAISYSPAKRGFPKFLSINPEQDGLVSGYQFAGNQASRTLDVKGNNNLSIVGAPYPTIDGEFFDGSNDGLQKTSASPNLDGETTATISAIFKPAVLSGNQYVLSLPFSSAGTNGLDIVLTSGDDIQSFCRTSSGVVSTSVLAAAVVNQWLYVTTTYDGTNVRTYVNGELKDTTAQTGTLDLADDEINIGFFGSFGARFKGTIARVEILNKVESAEIIKNKYNRWANRVLRIETFEGEGADGIVKTPDEWIPISGTFKVVETAVAVEGILKKGAKYLECVTAGAIAFPVESAVGPFRFAWYKGSGSTQLDFHFISDTFDLSVDNGFMMNVSVFEEIKYFRRTAGVNIERWGTATGYVADSTWYLSEIDRKIGGLATAKIKGGSFGVNSFTTVDAGGSNPFTDNTHNVNKFFVVNIDAGDRFTLWRNKQQIKL